MNKDKEKPLLYDANGDLSKKWFVYHYKNGKRIRVYTSINGHKSDKARRQAAEILINEIFLKKKLAYRSKTRKTVEAYLAIKKNYWKKKTFSDHKGKVAAFFDWLGFDDFNHKNIRRFFLHLMKTKSPTTHNNYRTVLRQLFRESMQLRELELEELFWGIHALKNNPVPPSTFSMGNIKRLKEDMLQYCPNLWLVCQLQFYCFIRPGEIRNIKVGDVILEESKIIVHASISKNKKTRFPVIPLALYEELERALKGRHLGEYLCPSPKGVFVQARVNGYGDLHREVLDRVGLPRSRYKLYSWKPTGMLQAIKNGASIKFLKEQAGHYSIDQTDSYLRSVGWRDDDNSSKLFPKI